MSQANVAFAAFSTPLKVAGNRCSHQHACCCELSEPSVEVEGKPKVGNNPCAIGKAKDITWA